MQCYFCVQQDLLATADTVLYPSGFHNRHLVAVSRNTTQPANLAKCVAGNLEYMHCLGHDV